MNQTKLTELVGGALQEQFDRSLRKVVENMQNPNTSFRNKREIIIKIGFTQNEARDDVKCSVAIAEKLAPQQSLETSFSMGKDIRTGELFCEEYGRQIRGQMSLNDYQDAMPEEEDNVIDFRQVIGGES